jgi:uncharacterized protein YrzB (UPF0473 family)
MDHDEFEDEEGAAIVTLVGDDGEEFECEVVEIFELDGQEYALLLPIPEGEDDDEDMVVMRVDWADDDEATFSPIEDDDEFERVRVYVETLTEDDDLDD